MCGIWRIIAKDRRNLDTLASITRMKDQLIHRGPYGEGTFKEEHIALAMRRLSIIDLSSGWQPLYNEDEPLVLITIGEIYNYIELMKHLEQKGHTFSTKSDPETIH